MARIPKGHWSHQHFPRVPKVVASLKTSKSLPKMKGSSSNDRILQGLTFCHKTLAFLKPKSSGGKVCFVHQVRGSAANPACTINILLVGGFKPCEKYYSNWTSSPDRGKNQNDLKPPLSMALDHTQHDWRCPKYVHIRHNLVTLPPRTHFFLKIYDNMWFQVLYYLYY